MKKEQLVKANQIQTKLNSLKDRLNHAKRFLTLKDSDGTPVRKGSNFGDGTDDYYITLITKAVVDSITIRDTGFNVIDPKLIAQMYISGLENEISKLEKELDLL